MLKFYSENAFENDENFLPSNLVFQQSSSLTFPRKALLPSDQSVHLHPIGFDCVKETYPHKVSWSEFPTVVEPTVALSKGHGKSGDFLPPEELAAYWSRQNYFLVDEGAEAMPARDRHFFNAVAQALRDKYAPGKHFAIRSGAKEAFRVVDDQFMKIGMADWKFNYCYKLNFRAIGFEVIRRFADVRNEIDPHVAGSTRRYIDALRDRWVSRSASTFDEPLALQVLFALAAASEDDARNAFGIAANFQDSSRGYTLGSKLREGNWVGTGKHEPTPTSSTAITNYILTFVALGFAELREETVSVTELGSRFLDALHKNNCDPDATLRFISPATAAIDVAEQDSMEAWLLRFFRKMKQKAT